MATAQTMTDDCLVSRAKRQDLQEMLREVGLAGEYWLPKLQEHLGITCAQALQHLETKDLQKLESQTRYPWEKMALEKMLNISRSNSLSESEEPQVEMIERRLMQAEQALQELRGLLSAGKQQMEEAVRTTEAEMRQPMDSPKQCWPSMQIVQNEVLEDNQRQHTHLQGSLAHRQNLPDRELVRWASGGLALQGIYKTSSGRDLIEKREELLSVPEDFSLSAPEQDPRMEMKEFASSEEESSFTQTLEKLGFSATAASKEGGWGFNLEAGGDHSKHSDSKKTQQSHSQHSYFCLTKFKYVPLASCCFPVDQLQLSKAALQELQCFEGILSQPAGRDRHLLMRDSAEDFFYRFGSHANQGPLHLGGIYWWKAVSEGFQREQLARVKQHSADALDSFIRDSYKGSRREAVAGIDVPASPANTVSQEKPFQIKVQLSTSQTGGPQEQNNLKQWKAGLVVSNHTWCVIDRGLQLVPVWDIILSSHRNDFMYPFQLAKCLKVSYTELTDLRTQIRDGEDILSARTEARAFLEDVKSWEVSNPEEQLKSLVDFMQTLSVKTKSHNTWTNICLGVKGLQNFLVNTVKFCKRSSNYNTKIIKSHLHILLYPHIYKVANFPEAHSIMHWVSQSESEQEHIKISQFSNLIDIIKGSEKELMDVNAKSQFPDTVVEAKRRVTANVNLSLGCFLNYLQETGQSDIQVLLLCIATDVGYDVEKKTFHYPLGCDELHFLLAEMQTAHDKYQKFKTVGRCKAHAFLVLTGLTATVGVTAVTPPEKTQRLALIKQHMEQSLSEEVAHVLTKAEAHHDKEILERDLKLLMTGSDKDSMPFSQMDEVQKQCQSLNRGKKQPRAPHNDEKSEWDITENKVFLELLKRLGLENYYPKKMTRDDLRLIHKTSVHNTQPSSEQELPFYFLQKLLTIDYGLRYLIFKDHENTQVQDHSSATTSHENEAFDPYEDIFEDSDDHTYSSAPGSRPHIHPMDIQMAILHCADDFARQYILGKLAICHFALPLLIPDPCSSQIEFSLWCLSQIRRSWQQSRGSTNEKDDYRNQQMCKVSTPIVSFIRVGNGFSASKSQIMNCLVSQRKHDVFFHRHSRGSSKDCVLMEGVVEICWFCPGGVEEDRFDNCLTFTNLHGDAKEHEKQLTFLHEVSSLLVVLMSASENNKENRKIVHDLCQSSKPIIFLLDDKEKVMSSKSAQRVKIGIRSRNEAELTEELATTIRGLLDRSDTALSLQACAQIARKQGFIVDEDQRDCMEAKEKAEILMSLIRDMPISQIKKNYLPLQGELWHLWCKKDKELYHLKEKGNRSIEQHKSEVEAEKQNIRRQQLNRVFPLNDLIKSLLDIFHSRLETHTKLYFLQWLSVLLDSLTAGHLEKLNEKKKTLWSEIQKEKQKAPKSNYLKTLENDIEAVSREINDSTLGIEHLLREVGQIYEAMEEDASKAYSHFLSLPQIAADLLIAGVPIELMDGDASYVPLKWVAAVFDKVSERLGDKRLFVLSILGLQSSGKSTLLNALFGLEFTVSAGRCTRGAYMQLLKVEETFTQELGIDFVLVVDTEGLRAPELNSKSQNHDNELATFVIGLGNLTVVNIFGENPSEMQDILQIVVQAFLRMKQVKISPSCLFVHQNVGEVTAAGQNMEGRRRLMQRLDEMAAMAAEQEQCSEVTSFSDVIKFDVNTHVFYFAHLWDGNPPMAPPNPRYSHNVQELKSRILSTAKQKFQGSTIKVSAVKQRVQDLWRALVSENFIFSFRNTQEVVAMSRLETMYNCWTWDLRSHVLELQDQLINQIKNGKIRTLQISTIKAPITKKYEAIKQDFETYFNDDSDSDILIQWKANFENKLIILKDQLISEAQRKANEVISFKRSQENLENKKSTYEKEILKRSRELALTVKDKISSEKELYGIFIPLWQKWVSDVSSTHHPLPDVDAEIDVDAEDILLEHFNKEKNIANLVRENYGREFKIQYEKHIQMKKRLMSIFSATQLDVQDKESIDITTTHIVSRYEEIVSNICKRQHDYNSSYFHEILTMIEEEVKSAPNTGRYTFTRRYIIDLCLILFHRASENFKGMHKLFKQANDPVNYLKSKKDDFLMSFKISCQGATSIKTFVDFLWKKLISAISNTVKGKVAPIIAGDMRATCSAFNGNRANLEKHILISLAEEEIFDNYMHYFHHPQSFFRNYIEKHVRRYFSEEGTEKMKTFLKISSDNIKNTILSAVQECTAQTKDKRSTASDWLDLFCNQIESQVILPRKDLVSIEHQEIKDIDFLKDTMSEASDHAMKTVEENCLSMSVEEMVPEIGKILSEHLGGCWKQCPFCRAICTNTIPTHDGDHSVPFHRPQCVSGWYIYETNNFAIDFCTSNVASDGTFRLPDDRRFPYKQYRLAGGEFATWSITPDSSTEPYWKWFICHFRSELENKYQKKFVEMGEIPEAWIKITKQDALDDLKK